MTTVRHVQETIVMVLAVNNMNFENKGNFVLPSEDTERLLLAKDKIEFFDTQCQTRECAADEKVTAVKHVTLE